MYGVWSFSLISFVIMNSFHLFFMMGKEGEGSLMLFLMLGCLSTSLIMLCLFSVVCFNLISGDTTTNYPIKFLKLVIMGSLVGGGMGLTKDSLMSVTLNLEGILKGYLIFLCEMVSYVYFIYKYF